MLPRPLPSRPKTLLWAGLGGLALVLIAASQPMLRRSGGWDLTQGQPPAPQGQSCTAPNGQQVPPGTVMGPYICRPDGTWGQR